MSLLDDDTERDLGIARAVLHCSKESLGKRVVVAHAGAAEGRHDAEALQGGEHGRALHGAPVVGVQNERVAQHALALVRWIHRYTSFIATKRGLVAAYRAGVPAFEALPVYFRKNLEPALQSRLDAAAAAGWIRHDVEPYELLRAIANLSTPPADVGPRYSRRMVGLLIDGLRYGAGEGSPASRASRRSRG
jgi:hypothetical protein